MVTITVTRGVLFLDFNRIVLKTPIIALIAIWEFFNIKK